MLYDERKNTILKQLALTPVVKIPVLSQLLQVSIDTIRRDLKNMETEGLLECVRGGARSPGNLLQFSDFKGREIVNISQKIEAAKKALAFVHSGDVVMLNSGTTNTILAQELAKLPLSCTVVTNNIAVVSLLMGSPSITVIVAGGNLDSTEQSLYGTQCEAEITKYRPDLCFLSLNAVDIENGFTDFRFREIPIMQIMQKMAKRTLAVMDSSKIGRVSKKTVFSRRQLSTIVMDDHVETTTKKLYEKNGIHIL